MTFSTQWHVGYLLTSINLVSTSLPCVNCSLKSGELTGSFHPLSEKSPPECQHFHLLFHLTAKKFYMLRMQWSLENSCSRYVCVCLLNCYTEWTLDKLLELGKQFWPSFSARDTIPFWLTCHFLQIFLQRSFQGLINGGVKQKVELSRKIGSKRVTILSFLRNSDKCCHGYFPFFN